MTAEYQYKEFRLPKATYAGRMENLRFDEFDSEEPTAIIQDEQEDDVLDFAETFNSSTDQLKQVKVVSGKNLRFTAPTFSEFDETHSPFDFDDVKEFQGYIKPNGLKRLSLALRLQLPDRNWLMAACELQSLLLAETHFEVFKEDLAKRLYPSTVN